LSRPLAAPDARDNRRCIEAPLLVTGPRGVWRAVGATYARRPRPSAHVCSACPEVELGGLEPPTSWVRCSGPARDSPSRSLAIAGGSREAPSALSGATAVDYRRFPWSQAPLAVSAWDRRPAGSSAASGRSPRPPCRRRDDRHPEYGRGLVPPSGDLQDWPDTDLDAIGGQVHGIDGPFMAGRVDDAEHHPRQPADGDGRGERGQPAARRVAGDPRGCALAGAAELTRPGARRYAGSTLETDQELTSPPGTSSIRQVPTSTRSRPPPERNTRVFETLKSPQERRRACFVPQPTARAPSFVMTSQAMPSSPTCIPRVRERHGCAHCVRVAPRHLIPSIAAKLRNDDHKQPEDHQCCDHQPGPHHSTVIGRSAERLNLSVWRSPGCAA
jgi:hypothetical protein